MGNYKFEPEQAVTRAQLFAIIHRMSTNKNIMVTENFKDVSNTDWFKDDARWARAMGLCFGDEKGNFRGNDPVSRIEIVLVLYRLLNQFNLPMNVSEATSFKDDASFEAWYEKEVRALYHMGLIEGEKFEGSRNVSREEFSYIIDKLLTYIEGLE